MKHIFAALMIAMVVSSSATAGEAADAAKEAAAIRETVKSYVAAFNAGDAEALAGYWCEDCEFATPGGDLLRGLRGWGGVGPQ